MSALTGLPRTTSFALTFVLMALSCIGCGGGDDDAPDRPTQEVHRGGKNVVVVPAKPKRTTPLANLEEATIPLPGGPDWLTFHGGFIWVKGDLGFVNQVDPQTNKATAKVRVDTKSDLCQGIGSGGGAVWSCSGSDIVRLDPKTLKIAATVPVAKVFDQGKLVFAAGRIWAVTGEGDQLVGIDTATNRPGAAIKLPVACSELAPGGGTLWVLCPHANRVVAVDVARGSIRGQIEVPNPAAGLGTDSDLWVGSELGLVRIDARSLEQVARFGSLRPGSEGTVAAEGDDVWVRTEAGFLDRIDARTNAIAEHIEADFKSEPSGGDLIIAAGSLWTTVAKHGLLVRLRPRGD